MSDTENTKTKIVNYDPTEMSIPLDGFTDPEKLGFTNPREGAPPAVKELALQIIQEGLRERIPVWPADVNGKLHNVKIGGKRRSAAIQMIVDMQDKLAEGGKARAQKFLKDGVPCMIYEAPTLKEAQYLALNNNFGGVDLTTYQITKAMVQFRTMGDSNRDIANRTKKSESWVSRKLKAWDGASSGLKDAWKREILADEIVESVAERSPEDQAKYLESLSADTKKGGKGGKGARNKAGKISRPTSKVLRQFIVVGESLTKDASPYAKGVRDAALYFSGTKGPEVFAKDWRDVMSQTLKDAEEAEALAKEAMKAEKAANKAAKKNGHGKGK